MKKQNYRIIAPIFTAILATAAVVQAKPQDVYGEYPYYTSYYEGGVPALEAPGTEVLASEKILEGYEACFELSDKISGNIAETPDETQQLTYYDVPQNIYKYYSKSALIDTEDSEREESKGVSKDDFPETMWSAWSGKADVPEVDAPRDFMGYSMIQEKVGSYQNVSLDLRSTVVGYVPCGKESTNELDFWLNDPAGFMSTMYQITFHYEILNHETQEPVFAKGYFGLMDYDYCQGTLFHGDAFQKFYVTENTKLLRAQTPDGPLYYTKDSKGTSLEDQDSWLAVCFEGDSFDITYTLGDVGIGGTTAGDGGFELQERVANSSLLS